MSHTDYLSEVEHCYHRIQKLNKQLQQEYEYLATLRRSTHIFGSAKPNQIVNTPRGKGVVQSIEADSLGFLYTISSVEDPNKFIYNREHV